uniref:cGMP-dependent protein kinase interacting domain-containing protein n=1 Tax=Cyprinus carpio TaxID=7962 RepID=A0A8C2IW09_CYPCA
MNSTLVCLIYQLYEDALTENEKLKSRLQDSKQELTKIRSQLDRVTQVRKHSQQIRREIFFCRNHPYFALNIFTVLFYPLYGFVSMCICSLLLINLSVNVFQKQDRISERSSVFESEKREKEALEKRVSDMEEELKVLTELKSDNQRLKDENGALIRVISKLSK